MRFGLFERFSLYFFYFFFFYHKRLLEKIKGSFFLTFPFPTEMHIFVTCAVFVIFVSCETDNKYRDRCSLLLISLIIIFFFSFFCGFLIFHGDPFCWMFSIQANHGCHVLSTARNVITRRLHMLPLLSRFYGTLFQILKIAIASPQPPITDWYSEKK